MVVRIRNIASIAVVAASTVFPVFANDSDTDSPWFQSYSAAEQDALENEKAVLLYFTGSDWCIWCQKLTTELFSDDNFASQLNTVVSPLRIDFPQRRKLPPKQSRANEVLKEKWDVDTIPTVIAYDPATGTELWRHGYVQSSPAEYATGLRQALKELSSGDDRQDDS